MSNKLTNNLGWVRSTRIKQGLKGFQLAEKLGVSAARVSVLEKDETRGAVTLKMMEKVANAMGCKFEYRIVPLSVSPAVPQVAPLNVQPSEKIADDSKSYKPRYRVV